jgi:heptosyltransferase I
MNKPKSICIVRLSALGDVTHVVPLVRILQHAWPDVPITWIIGKLEFKLLGDIPNIEFIVFDKTAGLSAYRKLYSQLSHRRFDVLLACQVALRANLITPLIRAQRRIGYDAARSKDGHGLFVTERISARQNQHALDALVSFCEPLGLTRTPIRWEIPIPDADQDKAWQLLPGDQPTLLISPCSSHPRRNWLAERYAAVADYAVRKHNLRVVLCGGPSATERHMADAILANANETLIDLTGKDTLKQFLALAQRAVALITPDSGPMHMANAVGTPVIGLHAASNPERSGPYSSRRWCVNRYEDAAIRYRQCSSSKLPWGTKLEYPDVMSLIQTEDVTERLDALMKTKAQGLALP